MEFVKFIEINDNEGEEWNFWLQLDDNEEELRKLQKLLKEFDEYGEAYALYMYPTPESEVDILVKHSNEGYMKWENKVTGKFTCPQPKTELDEDEGWQWINEILYKGDIRKYFK